MKRRTLLKYLGLTAGAHLGATRLNAFAPAPETATSAQAPGVFLNQLGYLLGAPKIATVRSPDAAKFTVRSVADHKAVLEGTLSPAQTDALSGDTVRLADFSALHQPGTYVLEVASLKSDAFPINGNAYADALRTTMRGYTGQRCGCAVDLGNGYKHPPCHLDGAYGRTSGKSGALPNAGGWHDAGDYGRYVVNSGITCGTLLWAWELQTETLKPLKLDFPKQHPDLPDYLEEVLWNLNWMLQLQDTDGGVFHKQTSERFCAFIMPQDDHLVSEVIGTGAAPFKSTAATADLAAVMAIAARCFRPFDSPLADRFLAAATRAWTWAVAHPDIPFENPPSISTGGYGDPHVQDEIAWASAELWRTTGEPRYQARFLDGFPADRADFPVPVPSWGNVLSLALWTYALAPQPGDADLKQAIQRKTTEAAAKLIREGQANGYGNTLTEADYGWGSNSEAANQSMLLLIADRLKPNEAARAAALNNLHYLLGRNCFGISWVTQVGTRPYMHPHHRPSAADGIDKPWPGLLSGGPNRRPGDPAAHKVPAQPPMRMWIDDQGAYSMNEIAINWNAPLVFLLAFANAPLFASKPE